jgi:hypothetical protein
MKIFFTVILLFSFGIFHSFAQDRKDSLAHGKKHSTISTGKSDNLILDYFTDIWQKAPSGMTVSGYSPGIDIYGMYNIPFGKSKLSLGFGFGFSSHNLRSDAVPIKADSNGHYSLTGNTIFQKIPPINNKEIKYDVNKLSLTYFEIPLELRFRKENKNKKAFKFSIGGKIGYLINSHTKYKGIQYLGDVNDPNLGVTNVKYKVYKIDNLDPLQYSATVRIGYGMFNIFGSYSLSTIFKKDKGPQMFPISVGISVTPI